MAKKKKKVLSLKGKILIASPRLRDPNFARTVVLVVQHDGEGALGFVLNRPTQVPLSEIWSAISGAGAAPPAPAGHAHYGGPVESGARLVIHGHESLSSDQVAPVPGVFLTNDVELLRGLMKKGELDRVRFYLGYSGWGAGQLDAEVARGDWLIAPATAAHVFEMEPGSLWRQAMESLGGVYRLIALMPPNPELN